MQHFLYQVISSILSGVLDNKAEVLTHFKEGFIKLILHTVNLKS